MRHPTNREVYDYVQNNIEVEGELELDNISNIGTLISRASGNPDKGCYVKMWRWVPDELVQD